MKPCVSLLLAVLALAGCATTPELLPPPTTAEVVQMAKSGEPADAIIRRMQESRAIYALPASELARLREQGVPDKVIDYMQLTHLEAVRSQEWARMFHGYYLYPPPSYASPWSYPPAWRGIWW